jgi:hypothetical protein
MSMKISWTPVKLCVILNKTQLTAKTHDAYTNIPPDQKLKYSFWLVKNTSDRIRAPYQNA